ncbi:hypothetical protein Fcan01_01592 [Folsomia candida]|uniref:Uncharacterized protein n=2 Tax=Folsomia candida TaxID=158441 RepID=A0A226EZ43_FOLCA|nr:hypothetical protein Fcan01_01592 [Folsomia candida]
MPYSHTHRVTRRPRGQNSRRPANKSYIRVGGYPFIRNPANLPYHKRRWVLALALLALFICFLVLIGIGGMITSQKHGAKYHHYFHDKGINTTYKIMRKLVQDCEHLRSVEMQFLAISDITALQSLIKTKLQPVQDIVTSLTSQTSQYERMERAEKPMQFITTAFRALDECDEKLEHEFDMEIQDIQRSDAALAKQLMIDYKSMVEENEYIIHVLHDENLVRDHIYITPPPEVDAIEGGAYIDNLLLVNNFDHVLTIVKNLVALLKKREEAWNELDRLQNKLGIDKTGLNEQSLKRAKDDNTKDYQKLKEVIVPRTKILVEAVKQYVLVNSTFIQLLQPHHSITGSKVAELADNFHLNEINRRKGYLDLRVGLVHDINKLRYKIKKL